jgi:hypothetical protein
MKAVPVDPFSVKKLSKSNPLRMGYVAFSRFQERLSREKFSEYALPEKILDTLPEGISINRNATAVTDIQMAHNVRHLKVTSGSAARTWNAGRIALVFIDAVHDYVNVRFDIFTWSKLLSPGGIVAIHDTDDLRFAGGRLAVFEASTHFELWAHPSGMVLLRKPIQRNECLE